MPRRSKLKEYCVIAHRAEPRHRKLLFRCFSNSSIQIALEDEPRTAAYLRRKIEQFISADPFRDGQCAIILEMNSQPIALAHFMWINWISRNAEIVLTLFSENHGLALAVMIIDKIAQIAFDEFNLHKFDAYVNGDNRRALRFFGRYMKTEAVLKAYLKRGNRYEDVYVLRSTPAEFRAVAKKHYK